MEENLVYTLHHLHVISPGGPASPFIPLEPGTPWIGERSGCVKSLKNIHHTYLQVCNQGVSHAHLNSRYTICTIYSRDTICARLSWYASLSWFARQATTAVDTRFTRDTTRSWTSWDTLSSRYAVGSISTS